MFYVCVCLCVYVCGGRRGRLYSCLASQRMQFSRAFTLRDVFLNFESWRACGVPRAACVPGRARVCCGDRNEWKVPELAPAVDPRLNSNLSDSLCCECICVSFKLFLSVFVVVAVVVVVVVVRSSNRKLPRINNVPGLGGWGFRPGLY